MMRWTTVSFCMVRVPFPRGRLRLVLKSRTYGSAPRLWSLTANQRGTVTLITQEFRAAVAAASPLGAVRESLANSARFRRGV